MQNAVLVMGVSGCGKTTVAMELASRVGWRSVDADDLHSPQAVAKMRSGEALNDADRLPWLDRVGSVLAGGVSGPPGIIVACSALRRAYRNRLRAACPSLRFVFLDGSHELIASRMANRQGHYMPPTLLESQLQTLERPGVEETDVFRIDIDQPLEALVQNILDALQLPKLRADPTFLENSQ